MLPFAAELVSFARSSQAPSKNGAARILRQKRPTWDVSDVTPSAELDTARDGQYVSAMVLARFRRRVCLLILVLVTGLVLPALAAEASCPPSIGPAAHSAAHVHADESRHSHAAAAGNPHASVTPSGATERPAHCLGCLTDAACACSCFGVAVLPASVDWLPIGSSAAWTMASVHAPRGVAPSGDIDPPRTVLLS